MFAGQHAAGAVVRVAVGLVRRLAKSPYAVGRGPPAHVVAGHVAEREMLLARMPDRPLGEHEAGSEAFDRRVAADDLAEKFVADFGDHFPAALRRVSTSICPTCQSRAATSSKTTQTSSSPRPVAAVIALTTPLAMAAFLATGSPAMTSLT